MTKTLQIGSETFKYPVQGTNPAENWGEEASEWAEAVTDALATVQGPNDILTTEATLANNQAVAADISGLQFDTGDVRHVSIEFLIRREYDSGSTVDVESGNIIGNYDGTDFYISIDSVGDSGVEVTVDATGQFQYTSDDKSNHVSSSIKFKARTIDA